MALTDKLTAIANAIRAKTGKTESLTLEQMPTEIESITTGGEDEKPFDCHSVTFMYGDTVLYVRSVGDGDTCADPVSRNLIQVPTKESDAQYDYTFYGWGASDGGAADSTILQNITEDKTVYAIFSKTLRTYTITWLDDDGSVLPGQTEWLYGETPSCEEPTKDNYTFKGWTPAITAVTGDASYTASWVVNGWQWDLTDGVLTISGSGPMDDFSSADAQPWANDRETITSIVVEDGITHIGGRAFISCSGATSVTIPDSVTSIGDYAFNGCTSLVYNIYNDVQYLGNADNPYIYLNKATNTSVTAVDIPDSTKFIGGSAFSGCSSLASIVIPDSVTSIGGSAFQSCSSLTSVSIGRGVTSFGGYAFNNCSNLTDVYITDMAAWVSINSTAYMGHPFYSSTPAKKLYLNNTLVTDIQLEDGIAFIGPYAFANCTDITSVTIPDSVTSIEAAFCGCTGLTKVTIPDSVTSLSGTFARCSNLTSVTMGSGLTSIGGSTFSNCTNLTSITIPKNVTHIGKNAFSGAGLKTAVFKYQTGWYVTTTKDAMSGTDVNVGISTYAATDLKDTYKTYYWYRK